MGEIATPEQLERLKPSIERTVKQTQSVLKSSRETLEKARLLEERVHRTADDVDQVPD
jgi:hypothetical protein